MALAAKKKKKNYTLNNFIYGGVYIYTNLFTINFGGYI